MTDVRILADEQQETADATPTAVDAPELSDGSAGLHATASPHRPTHVVGLGASAGGLEALEEFFDAMPPDSGMAFVVVQHLSPDFKSMMDELLARHTSMQIHRVEDGVVMAPNCVYLIPPKKEMIVSDGRLLLTDKDPTASLSLPIDVFFRSLARDLGSRAIGVVLSGTGSDGSNGIRAIHDAGGLVLVQDEESAKFDGMPHSASQTGSVDIITTPRAMPSALLRLVRPATDERESTTVAAGSAALAEIFALLRKAYGIDFEFYKPTTVGRRIDRRMAMGRVERLEDYLARLESDRGELDALYRDLLIGVTRFFRDPEAFARLEQRVIPALLDKAGGAEVRVWVPGCATGEEVFSLAILFHEQAATRVPAPRVKLFATDVHRESLATAAAGVFPEASLEHLSAARRARYFTPTDDGFQVSADLRQMVVFAEHNVIKDPPFTRIDLLSCRNLLIYLQPIAQKKVLSLFHFALKTGGLLFLGPSETLGDVADEFDALDVHWKMYTKRRDVRLPQHLTFPLPAPSAPVAVPAPAGRGASWMSDLRMWRAYDSLLHRYVPPSLLVNESRELVHTFGGARDFLRLPEGRATNDLLGLVDGELRLGLATAFQRVEREHKAVTFRGVRVSTPTGERRVAITVDPLADQTLGPAHLLVSFEEEQPFAAPAAAPRVELDVQSGERIAHLEQELQFTRENLQATVEELETSNEELQAANEELMAANEELQSTNEELHSVNEELYTVNAEHERKIRELLQVTNDMDNLLRSTEIGTVFLDRQLCIRKYTPAAAQSFNLLPQDLGRPMEHISYHLSESEHLFDEIRGVLEHGTPRIREARNRRGAALLLRILPYQNENREIEGVVLTTVDITEVKRQSALVQHMAAIVQDSDDAIISVSLDGTVRSWNRAAEKLLGYRADEIVGETMHVLVPEDRREEEDDCLRRLRAGEHVTHLETERLDRHGQRIPFWVSLSPIRDDSREITGISMILRDITERRRDERALQAAKDAAESASVAKSQFLANMSHEIRTPITGILGMTELTLASELTAEQRANLTMVLESGHNLLHIINDILDLSKIEAGKFELDEEDFDLEQVIAATIHMFSFQARAKEIELRAAPLPPSLPRHFAGDHARLRQVLVNLIGNAVKFTAVGEVSVSVDLDGDGDGPSTGARRLVFKVRDTGAGIPRPQLATIFESFTQVDGTLARKHQGSGLGLAISRKIVEMMGGRLWVDSEVGVGSTFWFTVALRPRPGHDVARRETRAEAGAPVAPLRVLVAEDNRVNQTLARRLLEAQGHHVVCVANGVQALEVLEYESFDLILMDIQMPELDGLDVTRRIRAGACAAAPRDIPIIALSAHAMKGDREKFLAAGMNSYLAKPLELDELEYTIREVMG